MNTKMRRRTSKMRRRTTMMTGMTHMWRLALSCLSGNCSRWTRFHLFLSLSSFSNSLLGERETGMEDDESLRRWKEQLLAGVDWSEVGVENKNVMLGSFSPQNEPYTYKLEEDITPSGLFSLGDYIAGIMFMDDDDKCYLRMIYEFQIRDDLS
ncbi:Rho GDP-dissociation inhibitor 1 [Dendrobium catenatum]|uniref:Rho GDP-dissociation inhibitor 1 n=1 Tax=Dendrobium catenatum TaxID=906689 RepID=A0A2I0X053_9ASPA|nr:Rho GDP-dissociation inhibitor 1 [Dendrobium catenatum]